MVCTKVKGEPIYEVVRPIPINQELIVYYLPERPEELFFARMRTTLYRQTMDSILEGKFSTKYLLFTNSFSRAHNYNYCSFTKILLIKI